MSQPRFRTSSFITILGFLLLLPAVVQAQNPPTGPAGGDLGGTYPNPTLAADRVRKAGDSMTGTLTLTLANPGSLVAPLILNTTGNSGPDRGIGLNFNLPASPNSAFGGQLVMARESWGMPSYFSFKTHNGGAVAEVVRITSIGRLGIGTTAPANQLHVSNATGQGTLLISGSGLGLVNMQDLAAPANAKLYQWRSEGGLFRMTLVNDAWSGYVHQNLLVATSSGNIGIGTATPSTKLHVSGDLTVSGNIAAKYQDVAEWVDSSQELAAGTVVVLDETKTNQVVASHKAYDTRVAGVISAQPGLTLGESGAGRVLVATTGRVRVKVDATRAPIQIGDLLVTGDDEGVAIKSEPISVGGVQLHRPGTLIGKALEPLAKGKGDILVLLSLQ